MNKRIIPWILIVVVLAVAGAIAWWLYRASQPQPQTYSQPVPAASVVAPAQPQPIRHPISAAHSAPAPATSTPAPLDTSDAGVHRSLSALAGDSGLASLLVPHDLIQHIVATVDALPRRTVNGNLLPVRSPRGSFVTASADGKTVISDRNAARYAPYMKVIESIDVDKAVAWYVRHYPQFQTAYEQLGYPKAYFNDRLVQVIDQLLATPDLKAAPALERPNVFYTYADPSLEALSAGQKMLLRAGPADEARIKAKLKAVRNALTGQGLPGKDAARH